MRLLHLVKLDLVLFLLLLKSLTLLIKLLVVSLKLLSEQSNLTVLRSAGLVQ